jgi:hypothetical protein
MAKLTYTVDRPYLTQEKIVRVVGVGNIPSKLKPHFRFLFPDENGFPRLETIFKEPEGQHTQEQVDCEIIFEFECVTSVDSVTIRGDGPDQMLTIPGRKDYGGGGEVPNP